MKICTNRTIKLQGITYNFHHSGHSRLRASQRGISEEIIQLAFCYGKEIFKQGLVFIAVLNKNLPDNLNENLRKKLNNLVVVLSGETDCIITCYKTGNAIKYINRKIKYTA